MIVMFVQVNLFVPVMFMQINLFVLVIFIQVNPVPLAIFIQVNLFIPVIFLQGNLFQWNLRKKIHLQFSFYQRCFGNFYYKGFFIINNFYLFAMTNMFLTTRAYCNNLINTNYSKVFNNFCIFLINMINLNLIIVSVIFDKIIYTNNFSTNFTF